jgi:phosphoserine phosphatase RsbU/P
MQGVTILDQAEPILPGAGRVLIADDQEQVLFALEILLHRYGFSTEAVTHPASVMSALQAEEFDAVLMDLNYTRDTLGGGEGLELVSQIRSRHSLLPIVVMTAWSSVDLAVEAMRRGAADFIEKPWDNYQLVQKLRDQLSRAQQQRQRQRVWDQEMQETRAIHDGAMPRQLPAIRGYEVAAVTQPLQFIGGDYYNVASIDDRHTVLCIADAAGKGLPAALLVSSLQAATRSLLEQRTTPSKLCARLNRILCDLTPIDKFVSYFYAVLDNAENRLTYCNAGHNPPLLMHSDGTSIELGSTGAVLGQFPNWAFEQAEVPIRNSDVLLLFTDGLVEACDAHEEPFDETKLASLARTHSASNVVDLMRALFGAASEHCQGDFQDDATLIVLKRTQ